jgi:hypothetical protein
MASMQQEGVGVRISCLLGVIVVTCCTLGEAQAQTVKSAVYINLENFVSAPAPTYSGLDRGGNCNTMALKLCTGIGYKFGMPVRMINTQMGRAVCFDTTGSSISIEDGKLLIQNNGLLK